MTTPIQATLIQAQFVGKPSNGFKTGNWYHLDIDLFPKQGVLGRIFKPVDLLVKCDKHKDSAYTEESFKANWEVKEFVNQFNHYHDKRNKSRGV